MAIGSTPVKLAQAETIPGEPEAVRGGHSPGRSPPVARGRLYREHPERLGFRLDAGFTVDDGTYLTLDDRGRLVDDRSATAPQPRLRELPRVRGSQHT
ncbi:hypothetical protein [Nocardia sp. NPDC047654]|uniref:hypothetical protein n=1 Tax=Nocardia sp. NPDC047654 TaxID=3364314 RepID=UPI00371547C2